MANPGHLRILTQSVEEWNKWRDDHPNIQPDLTDAYLGPYESPGDYNNANFRGVRLIGANLSWMDLAEADFSGADLSRADLNHADLTKAILVKTNLRGARLSEAHLFLADLSEADLGGASLSGADLSESTLVDANFSGANFANANLGGANLREANLRGAYLFDVDFGGADLYGTDFTEAQLMGTKFADVDLHDTQGLSNVIHSGPSTIGIDTIYLSGGDIPKVFLRGCGVPDEFIAYIGALVGRPMEFYSCFISYSTKDKEFAERVYNDLQGNGVRCWFAPHDVKGGSKIHEQIDEAISLHDKLLLILSGDSMASEWVKTEISKARKREMKEGKRILFPVRLVPFEVLRDWECFDADTGKDSAREIREYFIPDFSNWKDHDLYQSEVQKLVKYLKQSQTSKTATSET